MRIVAGTYRGRHLHVLKGTKLRPTSEQLRETLFDVLGPRVENSNFLDAYAGSGAVGLEALSRGASRAVFLEQHRPAVQLIRQNLEALEIESGFRVTKCLTVVGFERLAEEGLKFDFVYLDPPYADIREYHHALRHLARSMLLMPSSIVIVEHSRHCLLEDHYGALIRYRLLRHGDAQLAFYRLDGS